MAIAPTKLAQTSATSALTSAAKDPQLYAASLIQQYGGGKKPDYSKIVGQLEALQKDADPAVREFGQAVEREVVRQLGGGKAVQMAQVEKALNNATYNAGGASFSRNGDSIDKTRELAAAAPNKKNPSFVKYMEYDRAHGDGKWATNDSVKINEAWRNMIVAGASTPGEYAQKVGALNDNWGTTAAQYNAAFSGANLSAMADKAMAGLSEGYNFAASALSNDGSPASMALRMAVGGGDAAQGAFKLGVAKGMAGAAGDLLVTLGKVVRFAVDVNPLTGIAGDIARAAVPDGVKKWANSIGIGGAFDEATPSFARGLKSIEGAAEVTKKVAHYFATHSKLEIQIDIAVALAKKWESLSGEYNAMGGNPVKQAEWLGEKTGAVLFEVASSFIPVAGVAGKVIKGGDAAIDAARGLEKLDDLTDAGRISGKADELDGVIKMRSIAEKIEAAKADQIRWGYNADKWDAKNLKKGDLVYGGLPGQSSYYTDHPSLHAAKGSRELLFKSLQVKSHPEFGYRPKVGVYEVVDDMQVPAGIVKANPTYGAGGGGQVFIDDYGRSLRLVGEIALGN